MVLTALRISILWFDCFKGIKFGLFLGFPGCRCFSILENSRDFIFLPLKLASFKICVCEK